MPKFLVYSIWVSEEIVEANSVDEALTKGEPKDSKEHEMHLSNWHVVDLDELKIL